VSIVNVETLVVAVQPRSVAAVEPPSAVVEQCVGCGELARCMRVAWLIRRRRVMGVWRLPLTRCGGILSCRVTRLGCRGLNAAIIGRNGSGQRRIEGLGVIRHPPYGFDLFAAAGSEGK
jgi:hypothetical protein